MDLSYTLVNADLNIEAGGTANIMGAATIFGDLTNHGMTSLNGGSLLVSGTITNNAVIDDGLPAARSSTGELRAGGDLILGPSATLTPAPGALVTTAGSFDAAIDSNTRFAMNQSELRMDGASTHTLELMSTDIGPLSSALNPTIAGHYPLGTLRIGPTATTVDLADTHDNDGLGQTQKEAIYTSTLIIDAGATLNTNGCTIYYETLTNNGSVDDPNNLVQIAACIAELTGDGVVDGADLATLLAQWGGPGSGDLTGDGNVDGADLAVLLAAWGACP